MADQGYGFDDDADDLGGYEFDFDDDDQEIDADVQDVASAGDLEEWARAVVRAELSPVSREVSEDLVLADQRASEREQQARRQEEADELEAEFVELQSSRPGDVGDRVQDALLEVAQREATALGDPSLAMDPRFLRQTFLAHRDELGEFLAEAQSDIEGDAIVAATGRDRREEAVARYRAEQDVRDEDQFAAALRRRRESRFRMDLLED